MKVSVVIPTLDAGDGFEALLSRLREQDLSGELEVVVVDSGSKDETLPLAKQYDARILSIPAEQFNHGGSRNLGIAHASGELVALLAQDALPVNSQWLAPLTAAFSDPKVAGVYSKVVPRPEASPLEERWARADLVHRGERLYKCIEDLETRRRLTPHQLREAAHFNNVASCVRRDVMRDIPFPEVAFGEDLAWGLECIATGRALVYEPQSVVQHSHPSGLRRDYRRHRADAEMLRELVGLRTRRNLVHALGGAAREAMRDLAFLSTSSRSLVDQLRYGLYSPALRIAQTLGQLAGSRDPNSGGWVRRRARVTTRAQ